MAKKPNEIPPRPEKPEVIPQQEPVGPERPEKPPEIEPGTEPGPSTSPKEIPSHQKLKSFVYEYREFV